MKHTPGPWGAKGYDTTIKAERVAGPDGQTIGYCHWPYRFRTAGNIEECKANARLIAAAPDLLESLVEILHYGFYSLVSVSPDLILKAEKAVRKARFEGKL